MSMQKKLDAARNEGIKLGLQEAKKQFEKTFLDGIKVGADAANEVWSSAIQNTHGVGEKTIKKIYAQAETEHEQRKVERKMLAGKQDIKEDIPA